MAKQIYSNFMGGLSHHDKNAPENTYYQGRDIDPYVNDGYLGIGRALYEVTLEGATPDIISQGIVDMAVDGVNAYLLGSNDHIYHIERLIGYTWDADFDGASHYYYDITGTGVHGEELAIYSISGTKYLLYAYNTSTAGDIGTYNLTDTFDPDYMSTTPTGHAALQNAPHPMEEWKSYLWIGNGRYVARFDGPNATIDPTKLDLGPDWEVTSLFSTQNYIGICAWKKNSGGTFYRTVSRIFMWDGTSDTWNYYIPCVDNQILSAYNLNGVVYLWTVPTSSGYLNLNYLSDKGVKLITQIEYTSDYPAEGDRSSSSAMIRNGRDAFGDRLFFIIKGNVFSYGRENPNEPMALTTLASLAQTNTVLREAHAGALKICYHGTIMSSTELESDHKVRFIASGSASTHAVYRANYKDFGQDIQINYVKLYFKPLASGDSVTPTLEVDYGTSVTLKASKGTANSVASWAADGAITSKKFVPPQGKQKCHTFRPVLKSWTGDVNISKIVVDFSFINDN